MISAVDNTDCYPTEKQDPTPTSVLIWHQTIWWWGSNLGAQENGEYTSLPLLPGPLWPAVVIPVRVPLMHQIELFKNCVKTNNWYWTELWVLHNDAGNHLTAYEKWIIGITLVYLKLFDYK